MPDISPAHMRTLASSAVRSKLPPSSKKETAKVLLDMFIQLFVAEGDISGAFELLQQYIGHPVMAQEPSMHAALAILSCLETIRFVHQTKPSVLLSLERQQSKGLEMGITRLVSDSDSGSDSDMDMDTTRTQDIPKLEPSSVSVALLCPSCDDVVTNPFQFFSSAHMLQQFTKIRTAQYIKYVCGQMGRGVVLGGIVCIASYSLAKCGCSVLCVWFDLVLYCCCLLSNFDFLIIFLCSIF